MPEIEFDCADCGRHVLAYAIFDPAGPPRCMSCDWITRNVAPEHRTATRERLGVPMMTKGQA